ncbi:DUF4326 domain-containing protein [Nocardioides marmoriginsengisoli]|uniref:DUF4326 domain-containing protein n=1 Tax=Nocardioides marmoriginsengisoli TaxID=661483 RepID=A0A3N0CS81_9ACTN|nr:DUF4326 domain-containing protein [Nocardioides marmoriginsengisoli]RNL66260.1 DUF4326 domain-containing protein [Nocardioides marmoriginsengisoli]
MSTPKRIQRRREKGWKMPEGAVYVGRGTKWGNPFKLRHHTGLARVPGATDPTAPWEYEGRISADGSRHDYFHPDGRVTRCTVRYMTPAEVVDCFRRLLTGSLSPSMRMAGFRGVPSVTMPISPEMARTELIGRDLVCWCPLDQPCHADVLLELANQEATR